MASCCQTLTNLARPCGLNMGGIKRIYTICYNLLVPNASGKIWDTTGGSSNPLFQPQLGQDSTGVTIGCFNTIDFYRETGSFTTETQFIENQTAAYFQTEITIVLNKLDPSTMTTIENLQKSELAIVVEDNNGNFWGFGNAYPVLASAGSATTGTAFTDPNATTLTFTASELTMPMPVDGTYIKGHLCTT